MKNKLILSCALSAFLASGLNAEARTNLSLGFNFGGPGYYAAPQPVYMAPEPAYYEPYPAYGMAPSYGYYNGHRHYNNGHGRRRENGHRDR